MAGVGARIAVNKRRFRKVHHRDAFQSLSFRKCHISGASLPRPARRDGQLPFDHMTKARSSKAPMRMWVACAASVASKESGASKGGDSKCNVFEISVRTQI